MSSSHDDIEINIVISVSNFLSTWLGQHCMICSNCNVIVWQSIVGQDFGKRKMT